MLRWILLRRVILILNLRTVTIRFSNRHDLCNVIHYNHGMSYITTGQPLTRRVGKGFTRKRRVLTRPGPGPGKGYNTRGLTRGHP